MTDVERRNELSAADRFPEYCVYGKFAEGEHDQGLWETAWCSLPWLLEQEAVPDAEIQAAVKAWRAAEKAVCANFAPASGSDSDSE